jgi:hypothetical protein
MIKKDAVLNPPTKAEQEEIRKQRVARAAEFTAIRNRIVPKAPDAQANAATMAGREV